MITAYDKAIAAFIGAALPLLAVFGIKVTWLTPEVAAVVSTVLATLLTYLVPNKTEA